MTRKTDAVVVIEGKEYLVTGIKYQSGKLLHMIAEEKSCKNCKNNVEYPHPHTCDICTSLDEEENSMWESK